MKPSVTQCALASRLRMMLHKDGFKSACEKYRPYFGIDPERFRRYITAQLKMGWHMGNWGLLWQLGHIVPICLFDHTLEADLKLCWNYLNIMPVSVETNWRKGASLDFSLREIRQRRVVFLDPVLEALESRLLIHSTLMNSEHVPLEALESAKLFTNNTVLTYK